MNARAKGLEEGGSLEKDYIEIAELKLRLEEYASANEALAQRLEVCESENRRLLLENELLCEQLKKLNSDRNTLITIHHEDGGKPGAASSRFLTGELGRIKPGLGLRHHRASLDLETANRLLAALEDAPLHMSYCDSQLRYVWFNHTLKGLTHDEIVGKRDEDIIPTDSEGLRQFIDLKRKALQTGQIQVGEVTLDWPENSRVTWMVTTKPHLSYDGFVVGVSTASIDITEQVEIKECLFKLRAEMSAHKATEDELRRAVQVTEDAIQAKNVFLAIMSHEIRTPLNGLLGLAEALDSLELSEEQRELVSAILSSGVIVADILSDILDLASMEFGGLELEERPFDPSEIVQDIMKMAVAATRGKDVVVKSEIMNEMPSRVMGDAVRIRQIIKYLVLNAIKFTNRGSVEIRIKVQDPSIKQGVSIPLLEQLPVHIVGSSSISIDQHQSHVMLYCEVVDTGVGIPKEAFATLFDKFKQVSEGPTRSFGGTGLGLALCKRLVEFMGGQLNVSSEVGKGSTFAFTVMCKAMPCEEVCVGGGGGVLLVEGQADTAETASSSTCSKVDEVNQFGGATSSSAAGPRILLAEDNQVNVMVAISMLKRLGFTAKVVANGVEALEAIRKDKYDLVLLDICMPLMDGLQVAHAIRRFEQTGEWPGDLGGGAQNTQPELEPSGQLSPYVGTEASSQRLPIVAVTANALRSDVDKYFAHGMDAFIAKPVMFQKLQEILHRYLPTRHHQQHRHGSES